MDPSDGALCRITPEAPDGFYEKGALVTLQVTPQPGSRFLGWGGDVAGTRPMAVVEMNAPKQILARLEAVPYVKPSGVRNGAAETPVRCGGTGLYHFDPGRESRAGDGIQSGESVGSDARGCDGADG